MSVQLSLMSVKRKICKKCGRKNNSREQICYHCKVALPSIIIQDDQYFCYDCSDLSIATTITKPDQNMYFSTISTNNNFVKICYNCCSQNYKHNKKCLRCNANIEAATLISSSECFPRTGEKSFNIRLCFTCKTPCNILVGGCKSCANSRCTNTSNIIFSPIIAYSDYRKFILRKLIPIVSETAATMQQPAQITAQIAQQTAQQTAQISQQTAQITAQIAQQTAQKPPQQTAQQTATTEYGTFQLPFNPVLKHKGLGRLRKNDVLRKNKSRISSKKIINNKKLTSPHKKLTSPHKKLTTLRKKLTSPHKKLTTLRKKLTSPHKKMHNTK